MLQEKSRKTVQRWLCLFLALMILPVWTGFGTPVQAARVGIKTIVCSNQYNERMRYAPTGSTEPITADVRLTSAVPEETTFRLAVDIEDSDVVDIADDGASVVSFTVPKGRDHTQFTFSLQCKKEGTTSILVSDADNSSVFTEYTLTVQTPGIYPQSEITLTKDQPTATLRGVMKDGSNPAVCSSSDTSVVTVNEDGDLTAQGNGTANIYFSSQNPTRTGALCAAVTVKGMDKDGAPNWVAYDGEDNTSARKDCFIRISPRGYTMRNNNAAQYWCTELEQIKEPVSKDDLTFSLYVEGDGVGELWYDWESLPLADSTCSYLTGKVLPYVKVYEAKDEVFDEAGTVVYDNYKFGDYRGRLVATMEDGGLTFDKNTGLITVSHDRLQDNTKYLIAIEHSVEAPNYQKSKVDLLVNDYILFKTTDPKESFEYLVRRISDYSYSEAMGRLLDRAGAAYQVLSDSDRERTEVQEAYRQYQYHLQIYTVTKEIYDIGTVNRDSGETITNCRKDYDALDETQKTLVGEDALRKLTEAEEDVGDTSWYSSDQDSFVLSDKADLIGLADLVNDGTDSFQGKTLTLTADVSLDGMEDYWAPIGHNDSTPFRGIFDGNGHEIKNLDVVSDRLGGFFGYLDGAEVRNLTVSGSLVVSGKDSGGIAGRVTNGSTLQNCTSNVNVTCQYSAVYIGGIAGWTHNSDFIHCVNNGTINVHGKNSGWIGGIVGSAWSYRTNHVIRRCTNNGNVKGPTEVGGIAGCLRAEGGNIELDSCVNNAAITSSEFTGSDRETSVGGLAGDASNGGTVTASVNYGKVNSVSNVTGGLLGNSNADVSYSYNRGEVSSSNSSENAYLGGLAGKMTGGSFKYCYQTGAVTKAGDYAAADKAGSVVGSRSNGTFQRVAVRTDLLEGTIIGGSTSLIGIAKRSETDMKTADFVAWLNQPSSELFTADSSAINDGYPVLFYQAGDSGVTYRITVKSCEHGSVLTSAETVPCGDYITLSTRAEAGYKLKNYIVNGKTTTADRIRVTKDLTVTAEFVPLTSGKLQLPDSDGYQLSITKNGVIKEGGSTYHKVKKYAVKNGDTVYENDELFFAVTFPNAPQDESKEYSLKISSKYLTKKGNRYLVSSMGQGTLPVSIEVEEIEKDWTPLADTFWYDEDQNEFEISSAEELAGLALLVNEGVDDFSGKTIHLTQDISLEDPQHPGTKRQWHSIGDDQDHPFRGKFLGGDHEISGLYIYNNDKEAHDMGLFGRLKNGTISGLTVRGNITSLDKVAGPLDTGSMSVDNTNTVYVGGVAGVIIDSLIKDCTADIAIRNTIKEGGAYWMHGTGGIAGCLFNHSCVRNCTNHGSVEGFEFTGGIAGTLNYVGQGECTVENCTNDGNIAAGEKAANNLGGIAGYCTTSGRITACVNRGAVTDTSVEPTNPNNISLRGIGGVAGFCRGTIESCCNIGAVHGEKYTAYIGGISGTLGHSLTYCYNRGIVTASPFAVDGKTVAVGGLVGSAYGSASNSYNTGLVNAATPSAGTLLQGGAVGEVTEKATVTNCWYQHESCNFAANSNAQYDGVSLFYLADVLEPEFGFADKLNGASGNAFLDAETNMNDGLPVLYFEQIRSIEVTKMPDQTAYTSFDRFSPAGMVVTATFENDETAEITSYTCDTNPLQVSDTAVTIRCKDGRGIERTAEIPIKVTPYDLQGNATITFDKPSYSYLGGSPVIPEFARVTDAEGRVMEEVTDFTAQFADNTNIGTGHVTIIGTGNYTGTAEASFTITPIDLSDMTAELSASRLAYNGKAQKPTVKIEGLKAGTDYTVSYSRNVNIGTATVTIRGCGNYTGTIRRTFHIGVRRGAKYRVGSGIYQVTSAAEGGRGTVQLTGVSSRSIRSFTVPTTVRIGDTSFKVTQIGSSALRSCSKLTSVTIGSNVTKIGSKAFYGDKKLKKMTVRTTKLTSVGSQALKGIYRKAVIKVPKSKYTKYKKLFRKKGQAKTVRVKK
ncbi:MAG: leucine-rich repeat protein [Anaerovoracaceae bacterium]